MELSRRSKVWIGIALGIALLLVAEVLLFRTTGRETSGPEGTIGAIQYASLFKPKPEPSPSPEPTDFEQYKVTDYVIEDSGDVVVPVAQLGEVAALAACRNRSFSIIGRSALGDSWRFSANVSWCYGTGAKPKIQSVQWGQSGVTLQPGWSYRGVSGDIRTGGVGQNYAYRRVTGHFEFCAPICLFSDHPWIAFTVRNNGTSTLGWGG